MAATKGSMTSLPTPQTIFVQQKADESEENRISFRDSLKFFQEQLVINGASFPSPTPGSRSVNGTLRKNGHRSCKEQTSDNNGKINKDSGTFEDEIQTVKSCKIAIPTVDTILESVRVLRAIQKSQEERGSSWNLGVTSKQNIDSFINKELIQTTDIKQNGYCNEDPNNKANTVQSQDENLTNIKHENQVNGMKNENSNKESNDAKNRVPSSQPHENATNINHETQVRGIKNEYPSKESNYEKIKVYSTQSKEKITRIKAETQVKCIKNENISTIQDDTKCETINLDSVNEVCSFWPKNNLVFCGELREENDSYNPSCKEIESISAVSEPQSVNGKKLDTTDPSVESNVSHNPLEDIIENTKVYDTPDSLRAVCTDFINQLNEKNSNAEGKTTEILLKETKTTTEILKIETYEFIETQKRDNFLLNESLWKADCSPNGSGSTKIESNDSDSGIGTQRSASSLSPNTPSQLQKDSWSDTCSSQYASAECSPYQSLNSVFEPTVGLNNVSGDANVVQNTEILSRLTEEWEDALEKPEKSVIEPSEDPISLLNEADCQEQKDDSSDKYLTDSSLHFSDSESHSDNVELDTEISYCHFVTNYTIENPCKGIQEESKEEPTFEICDNKTKEIKIANHHENNTCEQNIDAEIVCEKQALKTLKEVCEQKLETQKAVREPSLEANIVVSEQIVCEKSLETGNIVNEQSLEIGSVVSEHSSETEKVLCEQTEKTEKTVCDLTIETGRNDFENKLENGVCDQTCETEREVCEQTFETEREVCEQTFETKLTLDLGKAVSEPTSLNVKAESLLSLNSLNHSITEEVIEDDSCELGRNQKFTAASCDLISIVKSLYTIKENPAYQIIPAGDSIEEKFEETLRVLSEGAFCEYPEEDYLVIIENSFFNVTKDSQILLSLNMKYGEISADKNILIVDNRMGRCVHIRCDFADVTSMKTKIELHCLKHWQTDCLQLVHYPLKCHQNVVIIDVGSCSTRAGILMDQPTLPNIFFPTICATDKRTGTCVYGMEALQPEVRQHSNLSFPVRPTNKITKHTIDIDLIEGLFKKIFCDLKVDPTEYTVQVCLPRNLSINSQTALVKLLLEDLKVKSVSLTNQTLLTLYAHDVSTAVVVDIGDRTDVLPVVDGFIVESGVTRLPHGGQRLIHHMKHGLAEKRISLSNDIDSFVVQYIIENLAYIAEDYNNEIQISTQYPDIIKKTVTLQPASSESQHSRSITLEEARFKIPEGLFNPDLWGLDSPGIHHLVQKAIQATSVDARKRIAENIFVSGGVTMLPGFVERLNKEVAKLSKTKIIPKVHASNYKYHCTYIGACKFAKMDVFPQVCINLEDYTTNSASALKKCALYC